MKEHIEAIQQYFAEKGVKASVNVFVHDAQSKQQAIDIISEVAEELKFDYVEKESCDTQWIQTGTLETLVSAFYEEGE